ncbi:MAG: type IV secretory system conjugative DNA transfer family protein [Phycisphaeraceae bacterium]|nr:type IV secretory system conjugative DNA transfer family protein [Phycisphaeraceae bacterium]
MQSTTAHLKFPPFFFWSLAGLGWWGAAKLHALAGTTASHTASLATVGTIAAAWLGGRFVLRALNDSDIRRDRRRFAKQRAAASQTHGRARLASYRDLRKFGLTGSRGVFLGRYRRGLGRCRDVYYGGETHVLTIGPAGSGKTTSVVIPNILLNRDPGLVVIDIKGELAAVTCRFHREVLKRNVVFLNPFRESLNAELGLSLPDDGYNPCVLLRRGASAKDDCELLASLLLPMPPKADAKSEFFVDAGQQIISAALLDLLRQPHQPTLPALRRWLMAMPKAFESQLAEMASSTAFGGALAEAGGRLLGTLANAPEQFEGAHASAIKAVRIYDSYGPMAQHVSVQNGFTFERIKERPTTVYIILPSDRGTTHAAWMNLVLSSAFELVGRDRTNRRVTFLVDELANLGALPLIRAMALYRSQGVRIHGIIQQVSQIRRIYGEEGWRDIAGLCGVIQAFNVTEHETTKLLSEMSGHATVEDINQSVRPGMAGAISHADLSFGHSRTGQPLLRPDDIRMLHADDQIIIAHNAPPIRAQKVDYRSRRRWSGWCDPNPYYSRGKPVESSSAQE